MAEVGPKADDRNNSHGQNVDQALFGPLAAFSSTHVAVSNEIQFGSLYNPDAAASKLMSDYNLDEDAIRFAVLTCNILGMVPSKESLVRLACLPATAEQAMQVADPYIRYVKGGRPPQVVFGRIGDVPVMIKFDSFATDFSEQIKHLQHTFDLIKTQEARWADRWPGSRILIKDTVEDILHSLKIPEIRVLDLGCGSGFAYKVALDTKLQGTYVGLDSWYPDISVFRARYPKDAYFKPIGLCMDLDQVAWQDFEKEKILDSLGGSPDLIIIASTIHQFQNREFPVNIRKLLDQLLGYCKPTTCLMVSDFFQNPNATEADIAAHNAYMANKPMETTIFSAVSRSSRNYTPDEMSNFISEAGFKVIRTNIVEVVPGFRSSLYYSIIAQPNPT